MNFSTLDNILYKIPKDINNVIFKYYTTNCYSCNNDQIYCYECEIYNCSCIRDIRFCNVQECNKLLCCYDIGRKIHNENDSPYLCSRCWNIDIHSEILQDIQYETEYPENYWWCRHRNDFNSDEHIILR